MSLFNRRSFILTLSALPLGACGFSPVYKEGSSARSLRGQMNINLIESRDGFELLEHLEAKLGAGGANARYALDVDLTTAAEGLAISATNVVSRYNITGVAGLTVTENATGEVVFSDSLTAITAYSATSSTYSTNAASRDAYSRLVQALADQIVTRLAATSHSWVT